MATAPAEAPVPSSVDAEPNLLRTKIARPRIPSSYVLRPQVERLLDAGTQGPLTVVSAGPGWGKTLAAAAWAGGAGRSDPVAWVSLDASDDQHREFWSYFLAALRQAGAVPPAHPLTGMVPGIGDRDQFLRRLRGNLALLPSTTVVVLDDFHLIRDPGILSGVAELLRHRIDPLRLVLLSRFDPTLPLHRLRLADDLVEIRARDLAFDPAEAAVLLDGLGAPATPADAELLVQRTEGWPAGLRLAALFLTREDHPRGAADFVGDDRTVTSYLAEEVLGRQSPEMRRFLLRTSVAERLSSGLAEVLTGERRSQHYLEELESSNAFVVGLGAERLWFRYHALLREMLRHRLAVEEPGELRRLHVRAARWFAVNGYVIEALKHAADAEDWALVGRLFVTRALPMMVSVDRVALDDVLARVPDARLADGPELALVAAARHYYAGRYDAMPPHLDLASTLVDSAEPGVRTAIMVAELLMSAALARLRADMGTVIESSSQALELAREADRDMPAAAAARVVALGNLGVGHLWSGDLTYAVACLQEGLAAADAVGVEVAKVNLLSHLALATVETGPWVTAERHAEAAVEVVESRGWGSILQVAPAYLALAGIRLQQNKVEEAQHLLGQARVAAVEPTLRLVLGLAQARLDAGLGRLEAARAVLLGLREDVGQWEPTAYLSRWWTVTEAEVELASGNPVPDVERLLRGPDGEPPFARERLCAARSLHATGEERRAEHALAPLLDDDGTGLSEAVRTEAWLLTALIAHALREENRATEALGRAVALAVENQVWRPFAVLDGQVLDRLLAPLSAVDPALTRRVNHLREHVGVTDREAPVPPLLVPLTDRELLVLKYVPTMMTNTEIADELFVSVNTVKAHLKHIYRKLDVETRREAARRAQQLGLLSTAQEDT